MHPIVACCWLSIVAYYATNVIIPRVGATFRSAGLKGRDLGKANKPELPESMGAVCGLVYLVTLTFMIPLAFQTFMGPPDAAIPSNQEFSKPKFTTYLSALLSIQSMLFLGFADDVLNIRWRTKLFIPAIAALPLLAVYAAECGVTWVVVPLPLRPFMGRIFHLGVFYYIYMAMVAIFCTNSINILAGINGVEVAQAIVIGITLLCNSTWTYLHSTNENTRETHLFSMVLVMPFLAVSAALLRWNWYPARVFVGDTYTYFAGMVFAVIGILGHFSKTLLLFFIPQILNFVLSTPQLFGLLPCPRHRLPSLNPSGTALVSSLHTVPSAKIGILGRMCLTLLSKLGFVQTTLSTGSPSKETCNSSSNPTSRSVQDTDATEDSDENVTFTNLTLLNSILVIVDPHRKGISERDLALYLVATQIVCSIIGLSVRYGLVGFFYS